MKEFKYVITDNEGIHARPAGELVKLAKSFEASVMIEKEGKKADCKKIFGLMGLGAKKGHEVTFTFEGADEEAAIATIYEAMKNYNNEMYQLEIAKLVSRKRIYHNLKKKI